MSKYLDKERAEKYTEAAKKILYALIEKCGNRDIVQSDGLLLHGTYARESEENTCKNRAWTSAIPGGITSIWRL